MRRRYMTKTGGAFIEWTLEKGAWTEGYSDVAYDEKSIVLDSPGSNGETVVRCTFSGFIEISFLVVSNGESNYDYLTVGNLDELCTRSSYATSLKGTPGVEQTLKYETDKNVHFVEFCYSKDSSVDTSPDNAEVFIVSAKTKLGDAEIEEEIIGDGYLIRKYTTSGIASIPSEYTTMIVFLVGGGGGGSGDCSSANHSGCGGNGGEVITQEVAVSESTFTLEIGQGGFGGSPGTNTSSATNGGDTILYYTSEIAAKGGSKGISLKEWYNANGDNSIRPYGQYGGIGGYKADGEDGVDGIECSFLDDGYKYGASGGGGSDYAAGYTTNSSGGETGGGSGSSSDRAGDGSFYGAGGGGAGFSSSHNSGGNGYQGICIIKFVK